MSAPLPRRRARWLLVAATLITGLLWAAVVPPFEGPDESAFYKGLMSSARGGEAFGLPLYGALLKPALVLTRDGGEHPFQAKYNPSFRFVSNQWGRVNAFLHGRAEGMRKGDVNRMYLFRGLTLLMWMASLLLVFEAGWLFFGRGDLALLTAILTLSLPQLSFFASMIHEEATSTLLASAVYWAFAARVAGRIGRLAMWGIALAAAALAPFSDRQAYFLMLLVPLGLVIVERTGRAALAAASALLAPVLLLAVLPQFLAMRRDVLTVLAPFLPGYRTGWWNVDTPQYLAFEFAPKMFFGFFGWLGQPSILLPPAIYAVLATLSGLAVAGVFMTRTREPLDAGERRMAWIGTAGVLFTLLPILYANILISRNSWHGRWLFPSIGPIMIGLVFGFRSFLAGVRRRPHLIGVGVVATAAACEALWLTAPGASVRAGIVGNHYGDQTAVIATIAHTIVAVAMAGLLIECGAVLVRRFGAPRIGPLPIAAVAWVANLALLVVFVRPLYTPLDAAGFATIVREEVNDREFVRAGMLYRFGLAAYPASIELRRVAEESPLVLMSGGDDQLLAQLQTRIGRGEHLQSRAELMALARLVRTKGWLEPAALREVLASNSRVQADITERAEPLELVRAELDGHKDDPSATAAVIRAGGGTVLRADLHGEATLEGYTVHRLPNGVNEVIVYFRPLRQWAGRRLWIHAYGAGTDSYLALDVVPPAFDQWKIGELAWEAFQIPVNMRYQAFLGVALGDELGPGTLLGSI